MICVSNETREYRSSKRSHTKSFTKNSIEAFFPIRLYDRLFALTDTNACSSVRYVEEDSCRFLDPKSTLETLV